MLCYAALQFLYDYLVNYNGTGSLFVVLKNYENSDVDLEAIACVHSLHCTVQYSTVCTRLRVQISMWLSKHHTCR